MARERQTDLAVLGALSIAPMTGYALREGIRDVLGQFWSESFGQIYPTLARLEGERVFDEVGQTIEAEDSVGAGAGEIGELGGGEFGKRPRGEIRGGGECVVNGCGGEDVGVAHL